MSQITTHVLDTSKGIPAEGIKVILIAQLKSGAKELATGITNHDGRVADLLRKEIVLDKGEYKLRFETKPYYEKDHADTFYPYVEIIFTIDTANHYHVPLLLSPFGYSTYRGS
jgi:5-hydroxyisourate hydrolase